MPFIQKNDDFSQGFQRKCFQKKLLTLFLQIYEPATIYSRTQAIFRLLLHHSTLYNPLSLVKTNKVVTVDLVMLH